METKGSRGKQELCRKSRRKYQGHYKVWYQLEALLLDTVKSVLGQTSGKGAYNKNEAWWWNEEVQKAVKGKGLEFKQCQQSRCDEDKEELREAKKRAKTEVAKSKESGYKDLFDKLDSREGQTNRQQ